MIKQINWREMLKPGDWVVLNNNQEAVIIERRDCSYWVELEGVEGDQRYQMVQTSSIFRVSKNLKHWFLAV